MCFVWISEQTAIISLYNINWLVCITETECVYCAVRTGPLYTASLTFNTSTFCPHSVFMCFVWIWEQTAIISLYNINWLVCITEMECVYCAVRNGSLCIYFRWNLVFRQLIHSADRGSSSHGLSVSFIQLSVQLDCWMNNRRCQADGDAVAVEMRAGGLWRLSQKQFVCIRPEWRGDFRTRLVL